MVWQLNNAHGFDGSLAEIEKIYEIAVNGSDDEKISAANILCGASLIRGWSIQVISVSLYVWFIRLWKYRFF